MRKEIRSRALEKLASYGDIVNAGYGSMCMGSPFAPRFYEPGTNKLRSEADRLKDQKSTVIGGLTGLALANPYTWKAVPYIGRVLKFFTPSLKTIKPSTILKNPRLWVKNPKSWWDLATFGELGYSGYSLAADEKTPDILNKAYALAEGAAEAQSLVRKANETGNFLDENSTQAIANAADDTRKRVNAAGRAADFTISNAQTLANNKIDKQIQNIRDNTSDTILGAADAPYYLQDQFRNFDRISRYAFDNLASMVKNKSSQFFDKQEDNISKAQNLAQMVANANQGYTNDDIKGLGRAITHDALSGNEVDKRHIYNYFPTKLNLLYQAAEHCPWTRFPTRVLDNAHYNIVEGMNPFLATLKGVSQATPVIGRFFKK